jgi:hypothetical protein
MTLADIDKALAQWEDRLSSAAHNLFDLQNDPTYQCLTGTAGAPKTLLTGVTASRVSPALNTIGTLFQCFDLLRCTIDRAVQLRRDLPSLFGGDQKEREIVQLLFGKSVRLPTDQIPMAHRSLLTGADDQGCISPDELLKSMVKAFESARDGVMAIDLAWRNLGTSLGDATRQAQSLRSDLQSLEEGEVTELDQVEHALGLRRAQVQSDPLGTSLDLESTILPALDRLRTAVEGRVQLKAKTEDGLLAAQAKLQGLRDLQHDASEAWTEAKDKITGAGQLPPPLPEDKIEALREWLDRLREKFDGGMLRPVAFGLQNWNSAAGSCVSDVQKIHAANSAPLELRQELRGRLNALKAKAQAYRVAEDAGLMALATEAEGLLYTRPTPIDRAAEAVTRYQSLLNERTLPNPGEKRPGGGGERPGGKTVR